jgi:hypothetical protein
MKTKLILLLLAIAALSGCQSGVGPPPPARFSFDRQQKPVDAPFPSSII